MHLQLLTTKPGLSVFYDADNEWLYLDWQGDMTLPVVQTGCLAIAQCFLTHDYARVLNDNSSVTSYSPEVAAWLSTNFLPLMQLTGIECIAWTYSPNVDTRSWTNSALYQVTAPVLSLFDDLESAYAWLQAARHRPPAHGKAFEPSVAKREDLQRHVQSIADQVAAHRRQIALTN